MERPASDEGGLQEERCGCGNLLAKVSRTGIEIRCRRCKRVHRIAVLKGEAKGILGGAMKR